MHPPPSPLASEKGQVRAGLGGRCIANSSRQQKNKTMNMNEVKPNNSLGLWIAIIALATAAITKWDILFPKKNEPTKTEQQQTPKIDININNQNGNNNSMPRQSEPQVPKTEFKKESYPAQTNQAEKN